MAAGARGFRDQGERRFARELFDGGTRQSAAAFFVGHQQQFHRARGLPLAVECRHRLQRKIAAGLHVIRAGPEQLVALDTHAVALGGADRMYRVVMCEHQHGLFVALIAFTVGANPHQRLVGVGDRNQLDRKPGLPRLMRREFREFLQARHVVGRGFQ